MPCKMPAYPRCIHQPAASVWVKSRIPHCAHDACPTVKLSLTRLYQRKHAALEALKKSLLRHAFTKKL